MIALMDPEITLMEQWVELRQIQGRNQDFAKGVGWGLGLKMEKIVTLFPWLF